MNEILLSLIISFSIVMYIFIIINCFNPFWSIILITLLIFVIINYHKLYNYYSKLSKKRFKKKIKNKSNYIQKEIMTNCELSFYYKIMDLEEKYNIIPQLNLGTIIKKISNVSFRNELFRNIDFAIFSKDYSKLLLLIELNDKTHNQEERKKRDESVKKICDSAKIKIITFYTKYSNEKEYVINRILREIKEK